MAVSAEDFVLIWQNSKNLGEIVEKTGASYDAVTRRASGYRKKGINLKKFARGQKLDVDALNALIDSPTTEA